MILCIFAKNKNRKEFDMKVLLMILGGCVVGLIIGLIDLNGQKPVRKYKPKKKKKFIEPPGWGTPHGF